MTTGGGGDAVEAARAEVVGSTITGVSFLHDFVEIHLDDAVLTGTTAPFGTIGCQGVGPTSMVGLIGRRVDDLVVGGEYVAIDSGEDRLAFPIGGPTASGPESVVLVRPAHHELGIPSAMWVWQR